MPVAIVDWEYVPNLKAYAVGSLLMTGLALFRAIRVTSDPEWEVQNVVQQEQVVFSGSDGEVFKVVQPVAVPDLDISTNANKNLQEQFFDVVMFMTQDQVSIWILLNMANCSLMVIMYALVRSVFGRLRPSEAQHARDKLWNFVFYKFMFVFGVISVQYGDDVLMWFSWFTLLAALQLLALLAGDRLEYLTSSSIGSSRGARWRLLALLGGVQACCGVLFLVSLWVGLSRGRDIFAFMATECLLVTMISMHVVARLALQAFDADAAGAPAYYTHLFFEAGALVVEVAHVVHMVVYSNLVVSMASLVLLVQLRNLLGLLQRRLKRHRVYWKLARHMARSYPMASKEEMEKNEDNCAICWEPLKEARKLPCSHLFHNSCLCRWVQQDASCPTCRRTLGPAAAPAPAPAPAPVTAPAPASDPAPADSPAAPAARPSPSPAAAAAAASDTTPPDAEGAQPAVQLPVRTHNHLFHFDGSRYVSWFPSFSLEVSHMRASPLQLLQPPPPPQHHIDAMVRQVQAVFPQYPARALAAALAVSRSAAATADDILAGRLLPPEPEEEEAEASSSEPPQFVAPVLDDDEESEEEPVQFPSVAAEREAFLRRRRARLLSTARRRLLQRDT